MLTEGLWMPLITTFVWVTEAQIQGISQNHSQDVQSNSVIAMNTLTSVGSWEFVPFGSIVNVVGGAVGELCEEAESLLFLHDGSASALALLHLLATQHSSSNPRQVANIITWDQDPWQYYQHYHNSQFGLTLLLIHNASSLQHLQDQNPGWVYGPILLVALDPQHDSRNALWSVNSARYSGLLQPLRLKGQGQEQYVISFITLFPFNTPSQQYLVQMVPKNTPLHFEQLLSNRFPNFAAETLHLASWVDGFPVLYWSPLSNTTATGIGLTMLKELGEQLNFTYTIQDLPPDGQWAELINGSWTGLAGQLVRREKDLVINTFALLYDRVSVMDFSIPITFDSYSAVLRLPPPPPRWRAVFYPFTTITWSALAITLIIITIFFHILVSRDGSVIYNNKMDVVSTLVWMIRVLLSQSVPRIPSSPGTRPFLVCWWLVSLVLAASYITNIIAYITVPNTPTKIKTLDQLTRSKHPVFMGDYGSFVPGYLSTSQDSVHQLLSSKLILIKNYGEVKNHVMKNDGAFIEGTGYMEYEITQWPVRDLYYVEEVLYPYITAWAFQKGTPWVPIFNRYLSHMKESGLLARWRKEEIVWYRQSRGYVASRDPSSGSSIRALSLEDLQTAFYILGLGTILSTIVLVSELAYTKC